MALILRVNMLERSCNVIINLNKKIIRNLKLGVLFWSALKNISKLPVEWICKTSTKCNQSFKVLIGVGVVAQEDVKEHGLIFNESG